MYDSSSYLPRVLVNIVSNHPKNVINMILIDNFNTYYFGSSGI